VGGKGQTISRFSISGHEEHEAWHETTKAATHCLFDFLARSYEQRGHVLARDVRGTFGRVGARTDAVPAPSAHECRVSIPTSAAQSIDSSEPVGLRSAGGLFPCSVDSCSKRKKCYIENGGLNA